ncbi:MAG: hypothetical protein F4017_11495 [Acidimicrobiaceae bacterium]|nr:hypothetical protein [Acidimicrobiaceae bacterium]
MKGGTGLYQGDCGSSISKYTPRDLQTELIQKEGQKIGTITPKLSTRRPLQQDPRDTWVGDTNGWAIGGVGQGCNILRYTCVPVYLAFVKT